MNLGVPTLLFGNFNCLMSHQDKLGNRPLHVDRNVREFHTFVSSMVLIDLGDKDPKFTWCSNQLGLSRIRKCLDRGFASDA